MAKKLQRTLALPGRNDNDAVIGQHRPPRSDAAIERQGLMVSSGSRL